MKSISARQYTRLHTLLGATSALTLSTFLGGCISPPVEAPQTTVEQQTDVSTEQNLKDKVDLLFMIDDSGSMSPKQNALKTRFPDLIKLLDTFAADAPAMGSKPAHKGTPASYHIGVVTSDLGAPGIGCGSNLGAKLQAVGKAASGCLGPKTGNFLVYDQKNHANDTIPNGQNLETTFSCMATVVSDTTGGHVGCGFEHQLEAMYRSLHDSIPENSGFLRDDAILAIVLVTDEDDCSVDPTSDLFTNKPEYGPQNSFRCAKYGIVCDGQLLSDAPQASYANCAPATAAQGGKLTDLNKYINFLTKGKASGGVKENPRDVVVASISAPPTPVGSFAATGQASCGGGVTMCTNISHSCVASDNASFFGDPAVRINAVVEKVQNHQITSICDTDYKSALEGIGNKIVAALQPSCLSSPIADVTNPDCVVQDVTTVNGVDMPKWIPNCGSNGGAVPCWKLQQLPDCPQVCNPQDCKFQQVGVTIDRGKNASGNPNPAPPNTTAKVSCNTIAIANEDPNARCVSPAMYCAP